MGEATRHFQTDMSSNTAVVRHDPLRHVLVWLAAHIRLIQSLHHVALLGGTAC